jgi:DNA-binding NarL/FixJ family response regulator
VRVLLVDDHPLVRQGLRACLTGYPMEVVGEASNGRDAVAAVTQFQPNVVVMDVRMPDMDGIEALRRVKEAAPWVTVIMLSAFEEEWAIRGAALGGASGFLFKANPADRLGDIILEAVSGEHPPRGAWWKGLVEQARAHARKSGPGKGPPAVLTVKELDILRCLARGLSAEDIVRLEGIHLGTVRVHCSNALKKLRVSDRLQAVLLGIREGWLSIGEAE